MQTKGLWNEPLKNKTDGDFMCSSDLPSLVLGLTFSRQQALTIFKNTNDHSLILALLSWITPLTEWEGSIVFQGKDLPQTDDLICVGIRGTTAAQIRKRLLTEFERVGIDVKELRNEECIEETILVRATEGQWRAP